MKWVLLSVFVLLSVNRPLVPKTSAVYECSCPWCIDCWWWWPDAPTPDLPIPLAVPRIEPWMVDVGK